MEKTVAIVGRPNVGKSALFNRLVRRQISLVFDRPGTTRDRIIASCTFQDHRFTLIDTGGIGLEDTDDFGTAIAREADLALQAASDILFVVDAREGLTPLDHMVADILRRAGASASAPTHVSKASAASAESDPNSDSDAPAPVPARLRRRIQVVANKMDAPKQSHMEGEFSRLGFGNAVGISAAHGVGIDDLLTALTAEWPEPPSAEEEAAANAAAPRQARPTRVAIVGRPNVGKSSLINALLSDERTIVSPVSGTTRDAVDVPYSRNGRDYTLVDTAGMRQERRISDPLEGAMTGRSAHSINRADVCVLVIDAAEGVSSQDKKIGGLILEAMKPCVIVVNKWDLAREQGDGGSSAQRAYYEQVMQDLFFLHYASVAFLSAKTGERVHGLFTIIENLDKSRQFRFATGPLNRVISKAIERHPPPISGGSGRRLKVLYATQEPPEEGRSQAIPVLIMFVNSAKLWTATYQRYLDLQLRDSFDIPGVPIRFVLRERQQRETADPIRSAAGSRPAEERQRKATAAARKAAVKAGTPLPAHDAAATAADAEAAAAVAASSRIAKSTSRVGPKPKAAPSAPKRRTGGKTQAKPARGGKHRR
ncbi:MAG: ribosome biogenesis GTPase Der [Candidatus Methylacidiphilales bacterium]|nr:ribosome biogenesis GTPase Der [Candidatus Methylacidiphilales bacterium]